MKLILKINLSNNTLGTMLKSPFNFIYLIKSFQY